MALLVGLPESALVDESQVFPSRHHPLWFSMLIYHLGMNNTPVDGYMSKMSSQTIDIIN
jgi:hypothetical protein